MPQYSWQGISCSPVLWKRGREGRRRSPAPASCWRWSCPIDEAVDRIGAGGAERDRRVGRHHQALRRERVLLRDQAHGDLAVGADRGAEVALDELARQVQRAARSIVSTRDGGIAAQCRPVTTIISTSSRDDGADHDRPAPLGGDGDRRRDVARLRARRSLHGPARQVHEEVEGEPDRHHDRRGDAGHRERAAPGRCATIASIAPLRRTRSSAAGAALSVVVGSWHVAHSGSSLRSSLTCAGVTGVPWLPHAVADVGDDGRDLVVVQRCARTAACRTGAGSCSVPGA